MAKVSNKKKSNNTNPIKKLSDIVPELALFDKVPKQSASSLLLTKAQSAARYSKEKKLSKNTKSKIKSLFSSDHFLVVTYMRDMLRGIPDLSRDERNHWHHKLTEHYDKIKVLLFESLDNNVSNLAKFNELVKEGFGIDQGLCFDAGSYLGCGTIDKNTRVVKFPKPAEIRQETSGGNAGNTTKPKKKLKPLSEKAAAVLELLKTLPEHRGMTGPKILETLDKKNIMIDQSTLTKNIIPELKPYGVKNRPRIGYYIEE
jgi:hypothetical protein